MSDCLGRLDGGSGRPLVDGLTAGAGTDTPKRIGGPQGSQPSGSQKGHCQASGTGRLNRTVWVGPVIGNPGRSCPRWLRVTAGTAGLTSAVPGVATVGVVGESSWCSGTVGVAAAVDVVASVGVVAASAGDVRPCHRPRGESRSAG